MYSQSQETDFAEWMSFLQTKDQFTEKDDDKEDDSHEMISDKSRTWQDVLDHTKKSLFMTAQRDHASESNESYVSLRRSSRTGLQELRERSFGSPKGYPNIN